MAPLVAFIIAWLLLYALHRLANVAHPLSPSPSPHSLTITWYGFATFSTRSLNPTLHYLSRRFSRLLRLWFTPGPLIALLGLLLSLSLLLYNLLSLLLLYTSTYITPSPTPSLTSSNLLSIALPGVTLPLSSLPYLSLAVLISVALHEAGHALCAEAVGQRVKRVGIFWCLFFPGAWVEVEEEEEEGPGEGEEQGEGRMDEGREGGVSAEARLAVVTAGVWHNLIVAVLGIMALLSMPALLSPLYELSAAGQGGGGPTLLSANGEVSPALASSPLLHAGDRLTSVNGRAVRSVSEWQDALMDVYSAPHSHPDGRCLSTSALLDTARIQRRHSQQLLHFKENRTWQEVNAAVVTALAGTSEEAAILRPSGDWDDPTLVDRALVRFDAGQLSAADVAFACCIPQLAHHSSLLCFNFTSAALSHSVCIQPRGIIDSTSRLCTSNPNCLPSATSVAPMPIGEETSCATLYHFNPSFRLFAIGRAAVSPLSSPVASSHRSLLFVGSSVELLLALRCTNYAMRRWVQLLALPSSTLFAWLVTLPDALVRLTQFTVAVSSSLFILNCLPVPLSDGQLAVALMADMAAADGTPTGQTQSSFARLLRRLPRWVWEERWIRRLGHCSLVLFSINVALTLVPALYTVVTW